MHNTHKPAFGRATAQALESSRLLDPQWDEWTPAEREGFLRQFFNRAEALKPAMMR